MLKCVGVTLFSIFVSWPIPAPSITIIILITPFVGPIENKQPLSVRRLLLGGQTRADLSIQLMNKENVTREVLWLETMPWFIYFYLHTLTATIDGDRMGKAPPRLQLFAKLIHLCPRMKMALPELPHMLPQRITNPRFSNVS
jgi:Gpi16 subunit, GPI transamidase component